MIHFFGSKINDKYVHYKISKLQFTNYDCTTCFGVNSNLYAPFYYFCCRKSLKHARLDQI